ncbi:MAG: potassium channel family protein, partial [Candidatus Cloacimonadota bacterium]|nr:potassium channel family protein [Candidatus Cloacimonadota bacterium]
NIKKLNIIGIQNLGRINIDWEENKVNEIINNQLKMTSTLKDSKLVYNLVETTHKEKSEQFRTLKENFHKIGQYDDEDKAYVEFKKHELREEKSNFKKRRYNIKIYSLLYKLLRRIFFFQQENKYENNYKRINKLFNLIYKKYLKYGNIKYRFKKIIFEDMGLYGTSPKKVAISMFKIWGFFTVVYTILSKYIVLNSKEITELPGLFKAAYFSAITFLTIGYGDYVPNGIIRLFSGIEGFLGLFLMAYFTVAFVRKVLR